ncbi:hypothetical protein Fmac_016318 [Flemingia macrophylla]|uniref:3'-5' exonuclease domain-containing protein n=1 Tax=Flemingia macrophylla TaxID=520843 RepID=A0ABD1MJ76_9FABA
MNVDHDQPPTAAKAQALQTLAAGPLSSSVAQLAASSRCLPSDRDFHFYRNFEEFKVPVEEIARESRSMLEVIGAAAAHAAFPAAAAGDDDAAYEWLVNVNDDVLERFDAAADEFRRLREEEEENGKRSMEDDGFQLVTGRKKKGGRWNEAAAAMDSESGFAAPGVTVATKDKKTTGPRPKVPFHIPTIKKPQEEYSIMVNNANMPFEHVWLQRSDDGLRFVHPLEKLSVLDFVDKNLEDVVPVKPPSIENTPFKLVEEVKDLKDMAAKLRSVNEFAVDLEHNQYRSFQGLTCLMQISTRTEDFVVDTFKLRIHIGPYLREVFKDPTKRKASKLLNLERNSLEHILQHFCEVTANKEYQNADWRLRPLPDEMLRYAREDTHYLLYIYDLMRIKLFSMSKESGCSESSDTPLVEVYKHSYDVCMQLYEKELLTENSYLHIYGLQAADFKAQQLAIVSILRSYADVSKLSRNNFLILIAVAVQLKKGHHKETMQYFASGSGRVPEESVKMLGLCEWRDIVARAEDESTGYVLPNKSVLEIGMRVGQLLFTLFLMLATWLDVHNLICVTYIKAKQMPLTTSKLRRLVKSKHPYVEHNLDSVVNIIRHSIQNASAFEEAAQQLKEAQAASTSDVVPVTEGTEGPQFKLKGNGATVQMLKKPTGAFGALLGNSASKRKLGPDKGKEEIKLEQIRSSVSLPFHSFLGSSEKSEPTVGTPIVASEMSEPQKPVSDIVSAPPLDEIIMLESDTGAEDMGQNNLENSNEQRVKNSVVSTSGKEDEDEPVSLSELSSNFQKCFHSNDQNNKTRQLKKTEEPNGLVQLKPFDYEAARKQVKFGEDTKHASSKGSDGHMETEDSGSKKQRSTIGQGQPSDLTKQLQQGKRRQAFPASGNRSATFR